MRPMEDAPKDGTRILIKMEAQRFKDFTTLRYETIGTMIKECWWDGGQWRVWCGISTMSSTEFVRPLGWMPVPEEMIDE